MKQSEVLRHKKEGDKWYCIEAPEELHIWTKAQGWPDNAFSAYDVSPISVRAISNLAPTKPSRVIWTRRNPRKLRSAVQITKGFHVVKQSQSASVTLRIDSSKELGAALAELSEEYDYNIWEISEMQVIGKSNGVILNYKRHNPDGTGTSLYLHSISRGDQQKFYWDMNLLEQQECVGKFKNRIAACTSSKIEMQIHSCAIEKKLRDPNSKLRKK